MRPLNITNTYIAKKGWYSNKEQQQPVYHGFMENQINRETLKAPHNLS